MCVPVARWREIQLPLPLGPGDWELGLCTWAIESWWFWPNNQVVKLVWVTWQQLTRFHWTYLVFLFYNRIKDQKFSELGFLVFMPTPMPDWWGCSSCRILWNNILNYCMLCWFSCTYAWHVVLAKLTSVLGAPCVCLMAQIHRLWSGVMWRRKLLCFMFALSFPNNALCVVWIFFSYAFCCNFGCAVCSEILIVQYWLHDSTASICCTILLHFFTL